MKIFADTSALLKRYVREDGTDGVNRSLAGATALAVSAVFLVEAFSALSRRRIAGELDAHDYAGIRSELLEDLCDIEVVPLDDETLALAVALVERRSLRTLDSLPLACALVAASDGFLCADRKLLAAAAAEGLVVVDPTQR